MTKDIWETRAPRQPSKREFRMAAIGRTEDVAPNVVFLAWVRPTTAPSPHSMWTEAGSQDRVGAGTSTRLLHHQRGAEDRGAGAGEADFEVYPPANDRDRAPSN